MVKRTTKDARADLSLGYVVRELLEAAKAEWGGPQSGIAIPFHTPVGFFHITLAPEEVKMNPDKLDEIVKVKMYMAKTMVQNAEDDQ